MLSFNGIIFMESFERPYKNVSHVKALLLFFFRPKAFAKFAAEHDIAWVLSDSPDLLAKYQKGEYKPCVKEYEESSGRSAALIRGSLRNAALVVLIAAVVGVVAGVVLKNRFGPLGIFVSNLLQAVAIGIILWATLWQLTRDVQTFGGRSLLERLHSWIFNSLYTVGTFILLVVYGWQA
jgi:hypothetical protein